MEDRRISIDLHLHFDGSLSVPNVRALARLEKVELPQDEQTLKAMLTVDPDCRDLGEYLTKFAFPLSLLQSRESIEEGMLTLCRELIAENCIYAEIRFAPQLHLDKGLTQSEVVEAAIRGFCRSGLRGGLILCCMRSDDNRELNETTVDVAAKYLGRGVLALDLAGNEAGFATEGFAPLFARARDLRVPFTIHAGEADGAESVRAAVRMGAARIGHGVRSFEDESLMDELAKSGIPLELCPTSNLQTVVFDELSSYPLRRFIEKGICITLNSDNRSVSATDAHRELELVGEEFALTREEKRVLLQNSVRAAFASDEIKAELDRMIAEFYM
jgi:adenosine deaminase